MYQNAVSLEDWITRLEKVVEVLQQQNTKLANLVEKNRNIDIEAKVSTVKITFRESSREGRKI